MKKKIFYLPEFYEKQYSNLNLTTILLLKEKPDFFYNDIEIGAIYGAFPGMIWNGGRSIAGGTTFDEAARVIQFYNELQIPLRFTYTNCLLEKEQLNDTFCNLVTEKAHNGFNEILVNSPILEDYLKSNFPRYNYLLSTTKCERNPEKINSISKNYMLVVIDYRDTKNKKFLKQIKEKEKIEILLNDYCRPNCPNREKHYIAISKEQLSYGYPEGIYQCNYCSSSFYELFNNSSFVSIKDIKNIYLPNKIYHFKIVGRTTHLVNLIDSYVYYLIKPQYQNIVRNYLLMRCW